jgi:hypothetical protein
MLAPPGIALDGDGIRLLWGSNNPAHFQPQLMNRSLTSTDSKHESPTEKMLREAFWQRFGARLQVRGEAGILSTVRADRSSMLRRGRGFSRAPRGAA